MQILKHMQGIGLNIIHILVDDILQTKNAK